MATTPTTAQVLTAEGIADSAQDLRQLSADELRRLFAFASSGKINATRLAELRATAPPEVLAAIEAAAAIHFDRDNTNPFGRERLRRIAIDAAVAAHFQIPAFAAWQATQGRP